jgi:hypothetical protein
VRECDAIPCFIDTTDIDCPSSKNRTLGAYLYNHSYQPFVIVFEAFKELRQALNGASFSNSRCCTAEESHVLLKPLERRTRAARTRYRANIRQRALPTTPCGVHYAPLLWRSSERRHTLARANFSTQEGIKTNNTENCLICSCSCLFAALSRTIDRGPWRHGILVPPRHETELFQRWSIHHRFSEKHI